MTDFTAPGYGQPSPSPAAPRASGRQILSASWGMLRQDRGLLALPVISAVLGMVAAGILFIPGWAIGHALSPGRLGVEIGVVAGGFAASVVTIYFQAALVVGANERADGGTPTLGGVLRQTAAMWRPVLAWALVATTAGVIIRTVERRFGALAGIAGLLGGITWAIATFLAVPVVVARGQGPVATVKESASLLRGTWGTSLRTTVRFGVISLVAVLPGAVVAIGVIMLAAGTAASVALGVLLVAVGGLALLAVSAVLSAVSSYARALIYRYAVGQPVPGIPPEVLAGAFAPRRLRRR